MRTKKTVLTKGEDVMFKGKIKFSFGGAFNLLCLTGAGYLVANTIISFNEWAARDEQRKMLKDACKAVDDIGNILKRLDELQKTEQIFKEEEL